MNLEERLIFIVSQPRAGSTLLQNILSNNMQVNTVSEPWILLGLMPLLKPSLVTTKYDYNITIDAIRLLEKEHSEFDLCNSVKKIANDFYKQLLVNNYSYIIDKTPRYYEILDEIKLLYPKAKIIIVKRNPIDVLLSKIKKGNISASSDLLWSNRDLLKAPFFLENFLNYNVENDNVISVKYEDIVAKPELIIKNLYGSLGLEYHNNVLDISKNLKINGKYGDQNINSSKIFSVINSATNKYRLNKELQNFVKGYLEFLGSDFLYKYGNYSDFDYIPKKTKVFNTFLKDIKEIDGFIDDNFYNRFRK